jgi:hypothetical protein
MAKSSQETLPPIENITESPKVMEIVDVSYATPQAHRIVNVALHREYYLGIIFIFSKGRKYLYYD